VSRATATITVPGRAVEAERVWYDPTRWASWIDGFGHVVSLDESWPRRGARRLWDSTPGGRGRVSEHVVAYEMRTGQTLAFEDGRMEGTERVVFEPQPDSVKITLILEYRMKARDLWWPGVDLLVGRRRQSDALRRTLRRFASELAAERQFGTPR
jgi:Polyketide cyclase / dehydrase and lipid transport